MTDFWNKIDQVSRTNYFSILFASVSDILYITAICSFHINFSIVNTDLNNDLIM